MIGSWINKIAEEQRIKVNGELVRYDLVPVDYMADGLAMYLEVGIAPGSFMTAVLCNDLKGAVARADDTNRRFIYEWVYWLYNYAPTGSWGGPDEFQNWQHRRAEARASMQAGAA